MKNFIYSFIIISTSISTSALAQVDGLFKNNTFDCAVIGFISNDENKGFEFTFQIVQNQNSNEAHGGKERSFTYKNHEVTVVANDKWLGLAWWINNKKIGETIYVHTDPNVSSRTLLLMNPLNDEDQLSLNCNLKN
ncbi:MAG: hypothetical protein KDD34_03125 [Bdellovibrionales bacterium]|nr:hypothetical protein [Bdellovibrionales bacterium]